MDDVLYREEILEYAFSTIHRGRLESPDYQADLNNAFCGDRIHLELGVDSRSIVERARFDGQGCAISQAAAAMLAEWVEGKPLAEARAFSADDMLEHLGIRPNPARLKCALLAWRALQRAIQADRPE
ncbi:MAG: iron-sulfur cluster assembly scaffold protein [Isosphaeraceae bacterium]